MNPYLPLWEYIPDGEPYVIGGRIYLFGSHDESHGQDFCLGDYVAWSAPVASPTEWSCEGIIYRKHQDPLNTEGKHRLYAPDVAKGPDGRYYLYYALDTVGVISVAVCDEPAGHYEFYGHVHYPRSQKAAALAEDTGDEILLKNPMPYDPAVLVEDDRVFLYYGFCPRYYLVYASELVHELCYATGDQPWGPFAYGGTIISGGDIGYEGRKSDCPLNYTGNIHGGLAFIGKDWYIFYHRHTQGKPVLKESR